MKWGRDATVRERLQDGTSSLITTKRLYPMRYPFPPAAVVELFRMYYGSTNRAFAALDIDGQDSLRRDLEKLWTDNNTVSDGTTYVEAEYLDVLAIRNSTNGRFK